MRAGMRLSSVDPVSLPAHLFAPIMGCMSSSAFQEWVTNRRRRLDHLWELERRSALPWQQREIWSSLAIRLATEFQGFARNLNDEAIIFLTDSVSSGRPAIASALQAGLSANRLIGKGNPNSGALNSDFSRLGFRFWDAIEVIHPTSLESWRNSLNRLIEMRNGFAHDDQQKLLDLADKGYTLSDTLLKQWQSDLDNLAIAMDDVVGSSLQTLLGTPRPW